MPTGTNWPDLCPRCGRPLTPTGWVRDLAGHVTCWACSLEPEPEGAVYGWVEPAPERGKERGDEPIAAVITRIE